MQTGIDLLKMVFLAAAEGIIISDERGIITSANPMSEKIFGYDNRELEGKSIESLVPRSVKGHHEDLRAKYFKNPHPRPMGKGYDLYGLKKNGETFPLEISLSHFSHEGKPFAAAFITDISERKKNEEQLQVYTTELQSKVKERTQELEHLNLGLRKEVMERRSAERALQRSQKLYETVAKNFPNGSINLLSRDLIYEFSEGKGVRHSKQIIGTPFLKAHREGAREALEECLNRTLQGKESSLEYTTDRGTSLLHAVPIFDDQGEVERILIVEEDISEIKKAEQETRLLLEKERELNEMKSRFVSMASHEFRTPLSTILSSTSLIGKYTETDQQDKRDKHLERIKSSVKNLTEILNDFLSLEKLETGSMEVMIEKVDVSALISEILDELSSIRKSGQVFRFTPIELSIFSDKKLLRNILINLVSNAIKYSPEKGAIILAVDAQPHHTQIQVTDEGMGIPEEEQKNIFQRFFRAKNAFNIQGTGLGLHIVQKYVHLLKGDITLESQLGKGTTITINLPHG